MRCHRRIIESLNAGLFTQCRADASRKLREVVRLQKAAQCMGNVPVINLIVPLRAEVMKGTAGIHSRKLHSGLTERHATVHAARPLLPALLLCKRNMKFLKILDTLLYRNIFIIFSRIIEKSCYFSHIDHL